MENSNISNIFFFTYMYLVSQDTFDAHSICRADTNMANTEAYGYQKTSLNVTINLKSSHLNLLRIKSNDLCIICPTPI